MGATCFRDTRRVNRDRQRPALRINRYMAFATFCFLAAVVSALPPSHGVFEVKACYFSIVLSLCCLDPEREPVFAMRSR
jgi:hypothetical protein